MRRRHVLLAAAALPLAARAQESFPNRPLRFIVPFPPGGSADLQARILAEKLSAHWGQPVVIDNRPGAGTTIASAVAARAAPDGYSFYLAFNNSYAASASLYRNLSYDPARDLIAISSVADAPLVLSVGPALPVADLAGFLAAARAAPQPLQFGSTGIGAGPHLATEIFLERSGIQAQHIPFRGTAEVLVAMLAGQVGFAMLDIAGLGALRDGKLKPLAVTTTERWAMLPNVPTLAEQGLPGFAIASGGYVLVPAGVPPALRARLSADIRAALAAPEVVRRYADQGFTARGSTEAAAQADIGRDITQYGAVIRRQGLRAE